MRTNRVFALTAFALTLPWSADASTVPQTTLTGSENPVLGVTIEDGPGSVFPDDSELHSSFDIEVSDLLDGLLTGLQFHDPVSGEDANFYFDKADDSEAGEIDDKLLAVPEPTSTALLLAGIGLLLVGLGSITFYPLRKN